MARLGRFPGSRAIHSEGQFGERVAGGGGAACRDRRQQWRAVAAALLVAAAGARRREACIRRQAHATSGDSGGPLPLLAVAEQGSSACLADASSTPEALVPLVLCQPRPCRLILLLFAEF